MITSKLVQILRSLSESEIKAFQDFVASPYFNKKEDLIPFASYFQTIHPYFDEKKLDKQLIFSTLYPNETYNEKKLGYLMSALTKVLFAFLIELEQDKENKSLKLAKSLLDRNLDKLFNKEIEKANESQELKIKRGTNYYYENYKLFETKHLYFEKLNIRKDDHNIYEAGKYLDYFYAVKKLRHASELLNRAQVLGKITDLKEFESIIDKVKKHYKSIDIFQAYLEMLEMQTKEESLPNYINLKKIITNPDHTIPKRELNDFYKYAINYCIKRIKLDKQFYQNEALQLYIDNLKLGNLYIQGFLSQWTFKNIVKLGILCAKYNWTATFIEEYIDKIHPEQKNNAFHFNYAEIFFAKNEFDEAQSHLLKVEFSDTELAYNLGTRIMLIKIFFEKDEEEALLSQIAAFTIFLKRNRNIKGAKKDQYINFCHLLNKILRRNPKHFPKLQEEIKNTTPLLNSSWLLYVFKTLYAKVMHKEYE